MGNDRLVKLRKNLEELEERINNIISNDTTNDANFEKLRKHKKVIREVQEYYSKKVR